MWNSQQMQILLLSDCQEWLRSLLSEPDFLPSVTWGGSPHTCFPKSMFQDQIDTKWFHRPGLGTGSIPGPWIVLSSSMVLRYQAKPCFPNTDYRRSPGSRHGSNNSNPHHLPLLEAEHRTTPGIPLFTVSALKVSKWPRQQLNSDLPGGSD